MTVTHGLQKMNVAIALGVLVLMPVFFLPITSEFYDFNKQTLLFVAAGLSLLVWGVRMVIERQVRLTRSPLGLPMAGLGLVWVVSALVNTPNKWDAFFDPGQAGSVLSLIVLFFATINGINSKKHVEWLAKAYLLSVTVLGVVVILFASGLLSSLVPLPYMRSPLWTPMGNPFSALVFLGTGLVFSIVLAFKTRFSGPKSGSVLVVSALAAALVGGSLLMYRLFLVPNSPNRPVFLSQEVSWSIALETLKSAPILGTGPATYLTNFTQFRPISYNLTDTWSVRFATSSNYYLQLLSTIGIVGLVVYVLVALRTLQLAVRSMGTSNESSLHPIAVAAGITAVVVFVTQLFLPVSLVGIGALVFLLAIVVGAFKQLGSSMVHEANIDIVAAGDSGVKTPILPVVAMVLIILTLGGAGYFIGRTYLAEMYFYQALRKAAVNDGRGTYDQLILAYNTNPYRDAYRVAFSQTNLLLANALAGKKDLTQDDRTTIAALIQQAIREAKNAVSLNPKKVTNVENLAGVYQAVIPLAKGADAWTVASYRAAIQLDPANPNLRIALGGVLYQLKQYDAAIQLFQQAVDLRPTLANAYYNLSAAYREKGDFQRAAAAMQLTMNNVNRDSADYTKASAELEELKKKVGEKTDASTVSPKNEPAQTSLEAPKPLPSPRISPQVELPSDLAPDASGDNQPEPTSVPVQTVSPTPGL